jgi:hypothetical protein
VPLKLINEMTSESSIDFPEVSSILIKMLFEFTNYADYRAELV